MAKSYLGEPLLPGAKRSFIPSSLQPFSRSQGEGKEAEKSELHHNYRVNYSGHPRQQPGVTLSKN